MILDFFRDRAHLPARSLFIAYEVGQIGTAKIKQNEGIRGRQIEPLYFRRSQAEERNH
jgi:hypothetical protein